MPTPNFADKTIWTGDNLDIMRGMNSESVDLIYLDPPFNSNQNYAAPVGSAAAGAAFKDTWTLSDLDVAWMGLIADEQPATAHVLQTAGLTHGKGMQSYLTMMAVRLMEMRRLLKPTGSIYLHCDDTASHYLKLLMDATFGAGNFKNEIIWKRTAGRSDAKRFGRVHDVLLFYAGPGATWNRQYTKHDPDYVAKAYRNEDARGRWRSADLTASGLRSGESGEPWRGIDPGKVGRHWGTPTQGGMNDFIISKGLIPGWPDAYPNVHDRLDALDLHGLIAWPKRGQGMPSLKRYLESTTGTAVEDVFADVGRLEAASKERIGYPTQKPIALLERIISASSTGRIEGDHETAPYAGDVVLDPFCGCATALVAAEKLGRRWVGIDLSPMAEKLVRQRLFSEVAIASEDRPHVLERHRVTHRTDIPQRTDIDAPVPYRQNKHVLFGQQEGVCNGCRTEFPFRIFEVDHVIPQSRGGTDHLENLQLLCPSCNRIKGDRPQEYLVARLAEIGG